jgi:hypothetical protein
VRRKKTRSRALEFGVRADREIFDYFLFRIKRVWKNGKNSSQKGA